MDKTFFKNWVLNIPHRLRDLLWIVRAWSSIAPIFFFSSYYSAFWIFTFFNCFLKAIFWFKFLSSNSLIQESNIFGVFREDTCGISWSVIESTTIFLALIKFFLWVALASSPYGSVTSPLMYRSKSFSSRIREILYFHAQKLSAPPCLSSSWVWWVIFPNENLKWK